MSAEDRNSLVILKRWARNAAFLNADVTICLISENQIELNQGIVQHPGVASIAIPLPDYAERLDFIRAQLKNRELPAGSEVNDETLAKLGAGLKRVQLQGLISHAVENRQPLTLKFLSQRKKDLIEAESGGLLEFVQSRFDLSYVAGNDQAKRKLQDAASAIRDGNTDVLPMGYVICGPVGTGKTFITTCFAGEVGIPAVTLKNFRSMGEGLPGSVLSFGIDRDNDRLRAEAVGDAGDQGRIGESSGVDADFVSPSGEDSSRVVESANAASHGKRNEELAGGAADGIEQGGTLLVGRRDVEENNFIRAGLAMGLGEFGGVSGVAEVDELNAFDDASGVNVEASDDAFGQHSQRAQKLLRIFRPASPDFSGWNCTPKR